MLLLPERAASLEEWREKLYFPGGFYAWSIRHQPGWRLSPPIRPLSKAEETGWYDAVMHHKWYPNFNDPVMPHVDERGMFSFLMNYGKDE